VAARVKMGVVDVLVESQGGNVLNSAVVTMRKQID